MNNAGAAITIVVFLAIVALTAFFSIRWGWQAEKQRNRERDRAARLELELSHAYQAKIAAERNHSLALQKLGLERDEFCLKQYLALHRVQPETYIINEEICTITPFASVKKPVSVTEIAQEELETPSLSTVPTFTDLLRQGIIAKGAPLVIGMRQNGELRVGSWLDLYTLAMAGLSGTGKSTSVLFYLLQAVLRGARLVMIDPHAETKPDSLARRLAGLPTSCFIGKIAVTNQEILVRVRWTTAELKRRQKTGKGTPIILVCDEFTRLMRTKDIADELGELLEAIAQEGREYNVFALLTGQVWTATQTGGTELRYSIASSLIHRIQEAQTALLIPSRYAKCRPELKTGEALLYDTNGQSEILAIPLTTTSDVMEVTALIGTSEGTSWGSSEGTSYQLPEHENPNHANSDLKHSEVDTEPLEVPPLLSLDIQVLDCMSRGVSQNQMMAEVFGIDQPGAAYQQKLPELRAAMQRIAQFTRAQKARIGA